MLRPQKSLFSRRRSVLSFQTLEDRRMLAATTPDLVELTNAIGPNAYSGGFEQRTVVTPKYVSDDQGNRAIDLRVDLPGDQTVQFPSSGVNDNGAFAIEQSTRIVRMLVSPSERYVVKTFAFNESSGLALGAFNAAGALLERLVFPMEHDSSEDFGVHRGYIGDDSWFSSQSLKLPPQTTSIVANFGSIHSIGFLSDEFEGAPRTVAWSDEPLLISSKPVDFVEADNPIAVDPLKVYSLEVSLSTVGADIAKHSVGYTAYDRDGLLIEPQHVRRYLNSADTKLARELRPGDTSIDLADASGWSNLSSDPATRTLAWYGYQDANGDTYADYTYTRNVAVDPGLGLWAAGAVVGNRITLLKPWAGPTLLNGTAVRNAVAGSPLFAVLADYQAAPIAQARELSGVWRNGTQTPSAFPPGVAVIRPAAELNQTLNFNSQTQLTYRVATNKSPTVTAAASRAVTIEVLANDSGIGSRPRITQITAPKFGSAVVVSNPASAHQEIKYTAVAYFIGIDSFYYTVMNETGDLFTEQVSVSSLGSNLESDPALSQAIAQSSATSSARIEAMSITTNTYQVLQGSELKVTVAGGQPLSKSLGPGTNPVFVSLVSAPAHGSFKMDPNGEFRYFADSDFSGIDRLVINVSSGLRTQTVVIQILVGSSAAEVDQSKLGQIGLAEESFESAYKQYFYPQNLQSPPLLSWRVYALPFMGLQDLFSQFRLDEPWDSPNNLPLAEKMPDIYRSWGETHGNLTRFQAIQASQTPSPTIHLLNANGSPNSRRNNATHGEENTILVLQTSASNAVIWTKPEDLKFTDAQSTLAKLTAPLFPAYFRNASFGSLASSVLVPQDIPASQFASIATIAESVGVVGVDVASLARSWAERPDTPGTGEEYGIRKSPLNIQAISRGLSLFESTFKDFPQAATTNTAGQKLLSWRVQLLPYLGLNDLYQRFNLNEPWDSSTNIALLSQMPDVFRSATDPSTSTTTRMQFLDGADTAHDHTRTRLKLSDFRDGLSNTILFVEAGVDKAVPWTEPDSIPVE